MEYWQRPTTTLQYHCLTQFHLMLITSLLLLLTLRGTFCSAEISSIAKNEQAKTMESIDSATVITDTLTKVCFYAYQI